MDIALASGEVGNGLAERQWSDSGPALEGSPAVAWLWECSQGGSGKAPRVPGSVPGRVRLASVPLESVRGGVCQGSVPAQE